MTQLSEEIVELEKTSRVIKKLAELAKESEPKSSRLVQALAQLTHMQQKTHLIHNEAEFGRLFNKDVNTNKEFTGADLEALIAKVTECKMDMAGDAKSVRAHMPAKASA